MRVISWSRTTELAFRHMVAGVLCLLAAASNAAAGTSTIWTISAGFGAPILQQWDLNGSPLRTINAPHGVNGRGIALLGNVLYYTSASTNGVYAYDFATNTDLGTVFTIPGYGLGALATDGSSFYIGAYYGNLTYKYSLTGVPQGTVSFAYCGGFCDGVEIANGRLISNRGDATGPYDLYTAAGALITPSFIADPANQRTTGLAFDGTNYFVSRIYAGQILVFNAAGAYQSTITLAGGTNVEDIAVETSVLKLCKVAGPGIVPNTQFTFSVNGNPVSVPAGPPPGGTCVIAGNFPPGTAITVQEIGPAGFQLSNIEVAPVSNLAAVPDLPNRKVQVFAGSGVTDVTFINQRFTKGTGYLEICKKGSVDGTFGFTVNPGNIGPIAVPGGACSPAFQVPVGALTIQEAVTPGISMQSCATIPASRQGACNLAAQTSTVTVLPGGIGNQTIAIITNGRGRRDGATAPPPAQRLVPPPESACRHYDVTKAPPPSCRQTR